MGESQTIAILFGYNGHQFDGLERKIGQNSIESILFKAFAAQYPIGTPLSLTHISRASLTYAGEHAAKQVISLNVREVETLPEIAEINKTLPSSIRVFKILKVSHEFSARRACEARTVEYLVPTYVFAPPPEATEYCYPEEGLVETILPKILPHSVLYNSNQQASLSRLPKEGTIDSRFEQMPKRLAFGSKLINCFKSFFRKNSKKQSGSAKLQASLNATLTRKKTGKSCPPPNVNLDLPFSETLRRSLSRNSTIKRDLESVLANDISEREAAELHTSFEPLSIPEPTEAERKMTLQYRMSKNQYDTVQHTLALFSGTHNFHNYIPGSVQNDSRCYIHILNIEASPLEIHGDVEWLRVKAQAHSFARDQIRKMMGMVIMSCRTNTPRSVVGNSFGFQKIDIPEAPQGFFILDQPHYNTYNADCTVKSMTPISFGDAVGPADLKNQVTESIFASERDKMEFEGWVRALDNFSFMYIHYLNPRGVISKPKNFPRES